MKELVLNKKKSIVLSIIIPLIITVLMIFGYGFIPDVDEEILNITKSTWSLIPIFSLVLSCSMFWAILFFTKPKFKTAEIYLDRKNFIKTSLITYIILCVILMIFITITPTNKELSFDYVMYMKANFKLVLVVSIINSIIEIWLILFLSLKRSRSNEK